MMRNLVLTFVLTCVVSAVSAFAQIAPSILSGEVATSDAAAKQMIVKTKDGNLNLALDEKTEFKRVSPENPNFKTATAANFAEISQGDKIVAVVELSDDKKTVKKTRTVYLITSRDIAKKQEADQSRWTTRGIAGRVTAVNPAANEITVSARGGALAPERAIVVAANDKTEFRRYAANSIRYSEAVAGKLADLKVGDQLRAVGEKSADGARLTAEEVLSGSFRMVVGKIEAINAASREVTIKDAQTDKPVTITVADNTLLRRFPAEMAQRMAQFQAMRAAGITPGAMGAGQPNAGQLPNGANNAQRPNNSQPGQTPGGGQVMGQPGMMRGGAAGGRGDVDALLESMPALSLSELKVGDAIAALSSAGQSPNNLTAIKFVAGVEPFLNAPQIPNAGARQSGGRSQSTPSINIPGLDGFGTP